MKIEDYPHTMDPFDHQLKHLAEHVEDIAWGLLWEQGTAKTKPIIDTACYLFMNDKINGLLVVAPPGVERNWKSDELPEHMPPDIALETKTEVFLTAKKGTKAHQAKMDFLIKYTGFSILLMSYNAFMTKEGKKTAWRFLRHRRVLYALDESHNIKTANAKRTKSIIASGRHATYRRILTGTPMSLGAFDLYTQVRFLNENFWKDHSIASYAAFKAFFGEWFTAAEFQAINHYDRGYDEFIRFKNLDLLSKWLKEITDRKLKQDVLDLPPKLYQKKYFDLGPKARAAYDSMKTEFMVEFDDGEIVDGELPIVRLLRFQQIASNYVPVGDEEPVRMLDTKNPRLNIVEDLKATLHKPTIIWARFIQDIEQIMDCLGSDAVRYDGTLSDDEAERSKLAFQAGDKKWFVGTAQKGGPGLTLHQAKFVMYYNNSFRLIDRLQSEDRAHRAGMDDEPVGYIDIIGADTVDDGILTNLRDKRDISSGILGDDLGEWI